MDAATLEAEGWESFRTPGFAERVGGFWTRRCGDVIESGFIVEPGHANHNGVCHGGMLMTLADNALGFAVMEVLDGGACATIQFQTQFVAAVKLADFVVCRPELVRTSKSLVFLRGVLRVGERTVASVDGIWKVFESRAG